MSDNYPCPCGLEANFQTCCEPIIEGKKLATCPEDVMRSRYTAYTLCNIDYIFASMKEKALYDSDKQATADWAKNTKWLDLKIIDAPTVSENDTLGEVEFVATYKEQGQTRQIRERSQFKKIDGKWYYVDSVDAQFLPTHPGTAIKDKKIGRNDPCHCGSGKKYKKCCY